ncbi:MAG TPA: hypothetical protein VKW08_10845 [Xanthobacteraceae bacterium]|jgi:hypothetical protein|nr:hypothetical protein [Xanthobacteraceae bacterium]
MSKLFTIFLLAGVAVAVPYLLLRKKRQPRRDLFAYAMGGLASLTTSTGVFFATHAVLPTPALEADGIIGSGLICAVIGPALGVWAGKRVRMRAQARAHAYRSSVN